MLSLLAVALAPAIFLGIVIYGYDKYDREPKKVLLTAFLLGFVSVVIAVILEIAWSSFGFGPSNSFFGTAFFAIVCVGFSEEIAKFLMVRIHAFNHKEFNEPFDGIVYTTYVSLGFAALENVFYVFQHGMGVGILRMFTAVPAHYAFGVIMGYFIGKAKFDKKNRVKLLITGIVAATLLHGGYDLFLFQTNNEFLMLFTALILIAGLIISYRSVKILQRDSMFRFKNKHNKSIEKR